MFTNLPAACHDLQKPQPYICYHSLSNAVCCLERMLWCVAWLVCFMIKNFTRKQQQLHLMTATFIHKTSRHKSYQFLMSTDEIFAFFSIYLIIWTTFGISENMVNVFLWYDFCNTCILTAIITIILVKSSVKKFLLICYDIFYLCYTFSFSVEYVFCMRMPNMS